MKRLLILLLVSCWLLVIVTPALSQPRLASCDLCGYCPPSPPPSSWESCRKCLYESASSDPTSGDSLKIDETTNQPPTPIPGRWYTMIGCINTNLGGFGETGAAGSVVQILLNLIFAAAGAVALSYFIYGSFLIMTSQADPERLGQGRRVIMGAIVGIVFTLSSILIVNFLASGVLRIPGFGSTP